MAVRGCGSARKRTSLSGTKHVAVKRAFCCSSTDAIGNEPDAVQHFGFPMDFLTRKSSISLKEDKSGEVTEQNQDMLASEHLKTGKICPTFYGGAFPHMPCDDCVLADIANDRNESGGMDREVASCLEDMLSSLNINSSMS